MLYHTIWWKNRYLKIHSRLILRKYTFKITPHGGLKSSNNVSFVCSGNLFLTIVVEQSWILKGEHNETQRAWKANWFFIHLQKPLIVSFVFTNRKFGTSICYYCGEKLQLLYPSSRSIQNDYLSLYLAWKWFRLVIKIAAESWTLMKFQRRACRRFVDVDVV